MIFSVLNIQPVSSSPVVNKDALGVTAADIMQSLQQPAGAGCHQPRFS